MLGWFCLGPGISGKHVVVPEARRERQTRGCGVPFRRPIPMGAGLLLVRPGVLGPVVDPGVGGRDAAPGEEFREGVVAVLVRAEALAAA